MPEEFVVGDRIAKHFEIYEIKTGGMGVVYLCLRQPAYAGASAGLVALKTIRERFLRSEAAMQRFEREAEIWVKLGQHENIVQAYSVIKVEQRPYIALEWVLGHDLPNDVALRRFVSRGPFEISEALAVAMQICDGLDYASQRFNQRGQCFVHGDLKPENILITRENVAKVTDFGMAALGRQLSADGVELPYNDDATAYSSANVYGTPPYMAPEQFDPGAHLDARTDIYAVGCILYEMITGKRPFIAPATLRGIDQVNYYRMRHLHAPAPDVNTVKPDCPARVGNIIARCLRKEPEQRYSRFAELLDDLEIASDAIPPQRHHVPAAQPTAPSTPEWMDQGNAFMNLARYEDAYECFTHAVQQAPEDENAWWMKAMAAGNLRRYEEVLICIDQAKKFRRWAGAEKLAEHSALKASALAGLGRFDEAMSHFDEATRLAPTYANGWYAKGIALLQARRPADALTAFREATNRKRDFFAAWTDGGLALWQLHRYQEAHDWLRAALATNPRYALAWFNLGKVLGAMGAFSEAATCFERALAIAPNWQEAAEGRDIARQSAASK